MALEACLLAANRPLSVPELQDCLSPHFPGLATEILDEVLCHWEKQPNPETALELRRVASGYRLQIKAQWGPLLGRLSEEKPGRYSRSFLETLALIAYRQPVTKGEIEEIRGVTLGASILRTLVEERGWVRIVGHRAVPGRPALYATTKTFLDYFGLSSLEALPVLPEMTVRKEDLMAYEEAHEAQMEASTDERSAEAERLSGAVTD